MLFLYDKVEQELEAFNDSASDFLERDSAENSLASLVRALRAFKASARESEEMVWEIPIKRSLRTVESEGKSKEGTEWPIAVGSMCMQWSIRHKQKILLGNSSKPGFEVLGQPTVRMEIQAKRADHTKIGFAQWHFDLGLGMDRGFCTHMQANWPSPIEVPRFPSIIFMPMDALDFLLSELFPRTWPAHVQRHRARNHGLRFQQERLKLIVNWWADLCNRGEPFSSWQHQRPNNRWLITP